VIHSMNSNMQLIADGSAFRLGTDTS